MRTSSVRALAGVLALTLAAAVAATPARGQGLPADGDGALARLQASPRHGEWVKVDAGNGDMVDSWIVYPERSDAAPVVVVIHEIFGMSDWIRAVTDQLAAEGFIAIAPDLLSGKGPGGGGTSSFSSQEVGRAIRDLDRAEIDRRLRAVGDYAMALPSAAKKVGVVGFCWGGSSVFQIATDWSDLDAAVPYYGSAPPGGYAHISTPILAFYGGNDNRVTSTMPTVRDSMSALGKPFEPVVFDGAGHGFLRQQNGQDGANMKATQQAWPRTIAFFKEHLGR
jgi:carboxymethylenebutenolidase